MANYFTLALLTAFLLFSCQTTEKEKITGTWTYVKKIKDGIKISEESDDTLQINYLNNGEMNYLTNGHRTGIGFYSYKIAGDSIHRTNIQIDDAGKRDSIFLGSNKFSIRFDTMIVETDKGTIYYKKENE